MVKNDTFGIDQSTYVKDTDQTMLEVSDQMVNNCHFEPEYQVHESIHTSPRKLALVLPNAEQNSKIMSLQKSDPTKSKAIPEGSINDVNM